MNLEDFYKKALETSTYTLDESLELKEKISEVNSFVDDLLTWHMVIDRRYESVLIKYVASEIQMASISLCYGLYRQAFSSLRGAFELLLSMILFSGCEIEFREWEHGFRDISWKKVIDKDSGIFSDRFTRIFFPELSNHAEQYKTRAEETYRKLSEFVHGNSFTWESNISSLKFNSELFEKWIVSFTNCSKVISFSLCLRFMKYLDSSSISLLQPHISDYVGEIDPIRNLFGGSVEQ